jgi:hypothetical protein
MARRGDCVPWNLTERVPFSVLMRAGTGGWFRKLAPSAAGATSHSGRPTTRQKLEKLREAGAEAGATPQKLGPPPNPRGQEVGATPQSARTRSWGHPPIRADNESPELGPPVSSSLTGTAVEPKTVPPFGSERCQDGATRHFQSQDGATRQFASGRDGRQAQNRSPKQCHPSVRSHAGWCPPSPREAQAACQNWCHPSARIGATRQFSSVLRIEVGATPQSARTRIA